MPLGPFPTLAESVCVRRHGLAGGFIAVEEYGQIQLLGGKTVVGVKLTDNFIGRQQVTSARTYSTQLLRMRLNVPSKVNCR